MDAIINIQGEIGVECTLMDVLTAIQEAKGASSYTFVIDSIGGYVDEGFRIARLIEGLDKPTKTVAKQVFSIANIIFFAGQEREALPDAEFMLHMAWFQPPAGNADDLKAWAELLEKEDTRIREYISEKTGIQDSALKEVMTTDTFIGKEQAQKLGFFNKAVQTRVAAKYIKQVNNQNADKMAEEKEAVGLVAQIKALLNMGPHKEEKAEAVNMPDEETVVEQDDMDMEELKAENERLKLQIQELSEKLQKSMEDVEEKEAEAVAKLDEAKAQYDGLLNELQGIKKHLASNAQVVKHNPSFGQAKHNANAEDNEPFAHAKKVAAEMLENNPKYKALLNK